MGLKTKPATRLSPPCVVRYGATECVPQNDSQSDEYLGLVQQVPAETNSDITVAEAAELNHKKALDESRAV